MASFSVAATRRVSVRRTTAVVRPTSAGLTRLRSVSEDLPPLELLTNVTHLPIHDALRLTASHPGGAAVAFDGSASSMTATKADHHTCQTLSRAHELLKYSSNCLPDSMCRDNIDRSETIPT